MPCEAGRERGAVQGRTKTAQDATREGKQKGKAEERDPGVGRQQSAQGRSLAERLHAESADGDANHAAKKTEESRFVEDHPDDATARPTNRQKYADFMGPLEDGHEHSVHDAEHADEHGQERRDPAHCPPHAKSIPVAGVVGTRYAPAWRGRGRGRRERRAAAPARRRRAA